MPAGISCPEYREEAADEIVEVGDRRSELLLAPEDEQLPRQRHRPLAGGRDLIETAPGRLVGGGALTEAREAADRGEEVVEVVRDGRSDSTDGFQPLGLPQALLAPALVRDVGEVDRQAVAHRVGPRLERPPERRVGLLEVDRHPLAQRPPVLVAEERAGHLRERIPHDLPDHVLAPALEERLALRIHVREPALGVEREEPVAHRFEGLDGPLRRRRRVGAVPQRFLAVVGRFFAVAGGGRPVVPGEPEELLVIVGSVVPLPPRRGRPVARVRRGVARATRSVPAPGGRGRIGPRRRRRRNPRSRRADRHRRSADRSRSPSDRGPTMPGPDRSPRGPRSVALCWWWRVSTSRSSAPRSRRSAARSRDSAVLSRSVAACSTASADGATRNASTGRAASASPQAGHRSTSAIANPFAAKSAQAIQSGQRQGGPPRSITAARCIARGFPPACNGSPGPATDGQENGPRRIRTSVCRVMSPLL